MSEQIRKICVTGMGIALFVALTACLQVPVFENYYLCLGYIVMAVWLSCVGTASGTIVGTAGVILYCLLTGGLRGMPGWALGNAVIGVMLGLVFRSVKRQKRKGFAAIICIIAILLTCAIGILGVKSVTESILYAQPFAVRVIKNSYAFAADAAVLIVSLPICRIMRDRLRRSQWITGSETR